MKMDVFDTKGELIASAVEQLRLDDMTAADRRREYDYERELRVANDAIYRWRFVAPLECEVEAE